jgi:transposase-like protein
MGKKPRKQKPGPPNAELSAALLKAADEHRFTEGLASYVAEVLRRPGGVDVAFHQKLADMFDPKVKTGVAFIAHAARGRRPRPALPVACKVMTETGTHKQRLVPREEIARMVFARLGKPEIGERLERGAIRATVGKVADELGIVDAQVVDRCYRAWRNRLAAAEPFVDPKGWSARQDARAAKRRKVWVREE